MTTLTSSAFRILFVASGIGLSHLLRLLLIAEKLRKRNQRISFAYGGNHSQLLSGLGYDWFPIEDVQITDFDTNVFAHFTDSVTDKCIQDQLEVIAKFKPDVVVTDFHPTASISSRIAGVSSISVLNAYLTDYFDVTGLFIDPEKHPFKYRFTDWFARKILSIQKRELASPFRRAARKYGIRDKSTLYEFFEGDLNLIADLPEMCPFQRLPEHYHYIGPLIWEGVNHEAVDVPLRAEASQKVIYATIGNTGRPELLDLVMATFSDPDIFQVIMTTGPYVEPARYLGRSNIYVRQFIPGSAVMRQSDLVIHCGGNSTMYQCLANGLPAIVVPFNNDQRINARLVQRHGVGIAFDPAKLDRSRLLGAVRHILEDDAYRLRVHHFHWILRHTDGPKNAADAIMAFLGKGRRNVRIK